MTTMQDIDNLVQDYCGNYSTGTLTDATRYRAINRSIEFLKRVIAIPNDEDIYTFLYSDDQLFYDAPSSFLEAIQLKYTNPLSNNIGNKWDYFDYPTVLQAAGGTRRNRWSITSINGKKQIVVVGYNGITGQTLLTMDSLTNVAASADASGLALNNNIVYEGTGSIQFDIVKSAGIATITFSSLNMDMTELFARLGFLKFVTYMTAAGVSSISLKVQSSVGNYYTMTASIADDGTTFTTGSWQKIGFHTENAVATGSPILASITTIAISFNLGASFTSAADFLIDGLFTAFPEQMDLIHFSNIKGTDATGVTSKTVLDTPTDLLYFSGDYDDYADLIAQRATINLWPQLRGDKDALASFKSDFNMNLKTFGRRNPRKRIQGSFRHSLRR